MIRAEHKWDNEELELFRAGRTEGPAPGSADGVLAALGLGGPVGPGPEGPSAPAEVPPVSQVGPVSSPESMAPPPPVPASGIFAKPLPWIGAGGILLALIPAAMLLGNDSQETASTPTQEIPEEARSAGDGSAQGEPVAPKVEASRDDEGDAIKLSDLEEAEAETSRSAGVASTAARAAKDRQQDASQRPSLAEELAIIKLARSKLNAGNLAGAEAALAEHQKKFNPPRLASEARVIRVEILVKQGKMTEARALAAPLMKENSPYRARMETLLSSR